MLAKPAQALTVSNISFSPPTISNETNLPNGTSVTYTIDSPGVVQIAIAKVQNFGDVGTPVASITSPTFLSAGTTTFFWNGLWLINGVQGRTDGNFQFTLTLSTNGTTSTGVVAAQLVQINSVDIHNVVVIPSLDTTGAPTFPYVIGYSLAKDSQVSATIGNSNGLTVRTLFTNKAQFSETTISTNTVTWDGLGDDGKPVPIGLYAVTLKAKDPSSTDTAIPRVSSFTVASLAGSAADPQKLFENSAFVFPNPVRNGQGTFQMQAVRDGASLSLKIYTISGDLVLDQKFPNVPTSTVVDYTWNVTNQSGNKVGRGLYYYVVRETDSVGTLQTVKKMAVLP